MVNHHPKNNQVLGNFGIKDPITGELWKMKAEVKETIKIDDGKHEGVITDIIYKEEPYNYVDIVIKENENDIELKLGLPFSVTENTALGRVLMEFGAKLEVGKDVEIEDYIKKEQKVKFMTITEKTKKGTFARIVSESLKLKK